MSSNTDLNDVDDVIIPPKLSQDQQQALDLIKQHQTVFISGQAGSGKTFLLKHIIKYLSTIYNKYDCTYAVTSLTGISSIQIDGQTLHSWAGIGLGEDSVPILINKIRKKMLDIRWYNIKVLIIDEISMLSAELFEKLHAIACHFRGNNTKLFGGIQLILSGDFLQLSPIGTGKSGQFCFESDIWKQYIKNIILLRTNFRQSSDPVFQSILSNARIGQLTSYDKQLLTSRIFDKVPPMTIKPTKLYPFNKDVEKINLDEYNKLLIVPQNVQNSYLPHIAYTKINPSTITNDNKQYKEIRITQDQMSNLIDNYNLYAHNQQNYDPNVYFPNKHGPFCKKINLCVGAQVMLNHNIDVTSGLVNGLRGVITNFDQTNNPIITFDKQPNPLTIERRSFKFVHNYCIIDIHQYPLQLCWAMSIHKSQSQTLSKVVTDLSCVFSPGQSYVCLSRIQSLDGLYLRSIDFKKVICNKKAKEFYDTIGYTCQYKLTPQCKKNPFVPHSIYTNQTFPHPKICSSCLVIFLTNISPFCYYVSEDIVRYLDRL